MTAQQSKRFPDARLLILLATCGFAFKGIFAVLAYREGMSVLGVMVWRILLATPLFWLGAAWLSSKSAGEFEWLPALGALLAGTAYLSATACDFAALARIGAGPSRVILFSFPAFVLALESMLGRHKLCVRDVAILLGAWIGIALVAMPDGPSGLIAGQLSGVFYALGASFSYALFLVVSQAGLRSLGSVRFTALAQTGAAIALAAILPWLGGAGSLGIPARGPLWLGLMAVFSTVLPFFFIFEGVRRAGASKASLYSLIGPAITVGAAWLVLGESFSPTQLIGAALVVGSVAFHKTDHEAPGDADPLSETALPAPADAR